LDAFELEEERREEYEERVEDYYDYFETFEEDFYGTEDEAVEAELEEELMTF
jgi:hypothetical protein